MSTIKALKAKMKRLKFREREINKQILSLYLEINKVRDERAKARVNRHLKIGDLRLINDGITNYHCDVMALYEILDINLRGKWAKVTTRVYRLGYADGDYYTRIDVERETDVETLIKAKRIKATDFTELKEIFSNPDSYEKSKWDITNYGSYSLVGL